MLFDAQGHMIEAHGTRTVYMRLGLEGQSVGAVFRVTSVRTQILGLGKLVKQDYRFEAGPTGCKMSKSDRTVTLDVVKISLSERTPKLTRRLNELAMLVQGSLHQQWMGYLKNYRQAQARPHQALRQLVHLVGHQLSTWTFFHQLTTCESDFESDEHCGAQKHKCGTVNLREKRLNADLDEEAIATVPKTLKGPAAPTESERIAHEITHLPPEPCRETCV